MLFFVLIALELHCIYSWIPTFHNWGLSSPKPSKLFMNTGWSSKHDNVDSDDDMAIDGDDYEDKIFRDGFESIFPSARTSSNEYSISSLSLHDIAELYYFSIHYLGDYAAESGCELPIDPDRQVGKFMSRDQMASLLKALHTLEPYESSVGYDDLYFSELAEDLDMTSEDLVIFCKKHRIKLPFGKRTKLHKTVIGQIRTICGYADDKEIST